MRIVVEYLTKEHTELCSQYWELDGTAFRYKMDDLVQRYSISRAKILAAVKQNSTGRVAEWFCPQCNQEHSWDIRVRGDFTSKNLHWASTTCPSCREKNETERVQQIQKREEAFDTFLEGSERSAPDSERVPPEPQNTAVVRIKMGRSNHAIRFTDLAESSIHLRPKDGIAEGEVILKGRAVSGDLLEPWGSDVYRYLVSVTGDGTFAIHRVSTQPVGHEAQALVMGELANEGCSIRRELDEQLIQAIREDFSTVPEVLETEDDDGSDDGGYY